MRKADLFRPVTLSNYRLSGLSSSPTQSSAPFPTPPPVASAYEGKGGHVYSLQGRLNPQQGQCLRQLLPPHRVAPQRNSQRQPNQLPLPYLKRHQAMLHRLEAEIDHLFHFLSIS